MTNYTSNTYPTYLALTVLQKIIDGQALPEAPAEAEIRENLRTANDEAMSFIKDTRAAYGALNDLEETARIFAAYQACPDCLSKHELETVRDLYRFLSSYDVKNLIAAAIDDLNDADDANELGDVCFDGLQSKISSIVDPYISPTSSKQLFDENGEYCGFHIQITVGGPTLGIYSLDGLGTYVYATGRETSGGTEIPLDLEDLEIINDLYFSGSLDI